MKSTAALIIFVILALPAQAGEKFAGIDRAVAAAVERQELPGVVVLIVHKDRVIYRKAFGRRAVRPIPTLMTEDTVFDLASLTKPIFTALAILLLHEQDKLSLEDPIGKYIPEFVRRKETEAITIAQLLTHTGGFIPDNPLADYTQGRDKAWHNLHALNPTIKPGSRFVYSDVGYILLGEIVAKVSGMSLVEFGRQRIFEPLGMEDTSFLPGEHLKKRCAPTQLREGRWMIGEVHDPRAYHLGGTAGHAGLFSTADDLAIFARMLLQSGKHDGKQFLRPETIKLMTAPREVPLQKGTGLRPLGWDMATPYSGNRGEFFPRAISFGHGGFTGTSIWIDPQSQSAVIFLSNSVHPDGKGKSLGLRNQVSTLAGQVLTGR